MDSIYPINNPNPNDQSLGNSNVPSDNFVSENAPTSESSVQSTPLTQLISEPTFEPLQPYSSITGNIAEPLAPTVPDIAPEIIVEQLSTEPQTNLDETINLEPSEKVSYSDSTIQEIEVSKIVANPFQPRKVFRPEALQELADSIKEHGVIQPVVVTETENGYELVVGERRFRASQLAGLTKVPAIVKKTLQDQTKLEVALIENIQRQELNSIEEAQAYQRLMQKFGMNQAEVAKKVGKSRPGVANTLRLLQLPAEIQRGIIEGKIFEGHGRAILTIPDIERQLLMYKQIVEQGMNVRQVEAKVREFVKRKVVDSAVPDPKLMAIETKLRGKFGTQVKVLRQGRGGKITIEFFSDEDLDDIMRRVEEDDKPSGEDYFVV